MLYKNLCKLSCAAIVGGAAMLLTPTASADDFSISYRSGGVSVGFSDVHHRSYKHHDRHYTHRRPHFHSYRRTAHVCRYEDRPVTRRYYDSCGRPRYYTHYERVRVCRTGHHRYR